MTTTTQIDIHQRRWWCGGCQAWQSATLVPDADGEVYIACLNCGWPIARSKEAHHAATGR